MGTLEPRYSIEEFARRGGKIYERDIKPTLRPEDNGKFVAIDIESADYVIDKDDYTAVKRLLEKQPDSQSWLVRVGAKAAYRMGPRSVKGVRDDYGNSKRPV